MSDHHVPFNKPSWSGDEVGYIQQAFNEKSVSGDGPFTKKVQKLLEDSLDVAGGVLLTTSCTHALEMSAILLDLKPGDEVIVPSFTFVSTALAYHMHGATPVFADIRPDTLNLDENKLENLINEKTRAIVPVHYAGVGCEMNEIMCIASHHNLIVIEDNAHGLYGQYDGANLGTIGHMATQSFHETKNITCGEGGALILNDISLLERAEVVREKGTNRSRFFRGQVDKYTWVDKGSSYVMSDILAAFLYGQLMHSNSVQEKRCRIWDCYAENLAEWAKANSVRLPVVPKQCEQAYHMFYLLLPDLKSRTAFIEHMNQNEINCVFHYLPLDQSDMGHRIGRSPVSCDVAAGISDRLVRLPFYNDLTKTEQRRVIDSVIEFNC